MSPQQTAAQIFWKAVEDPDFLQSVKSHRRYHLRLTAIVAVGFGLFFNFIAVLVAGQPVLNGLAFLPVGPAQIPLKYRKTRLTPLIARNIARVACSRSCVWPRLQTWHAGAAVGLD